MHYGRRRHKFSRDLRRSKLSPLRYSRYARNGGYRRFYSEEKLTEEAFDVLAESIEGIDEAFEKAEKEAEKRGETDELEKLEEEIEKEIEAALKGKTNYSRLFSDLARGRLYNTSANELENYRSLAVAISVVSLNDLVPAYEKGEISEEDAEKSGFKEFLDKMNKTIKKIGGGVVKFVKFLARFIVALIYFVFPRAIIASIIVKGLNFILFSLAGTVLSVSVGAALILSGIMAFILALSGIYIIYSITKAAKKAAKGDSLTDDHILHMIGEVLRDIAAFNIVEVPDKIKKALKIEVKEIEGDIRVVIDHFLKRNRSKIETIAEKIEKDVDQAIEEKDKPEEERQEFEEKELSHSKLGRYSSRRGALSLMRRKRYSERGRKRGFYSDWD